MNTGKDAERMAENYLVQQGMQLLARNFSCRFGEIDLIMREVDTIVFVEVRYRRQNRYGNAIETVTARKQRKLYLTALHYLQKHRWHDRPARFDVVGMSPAVDGGTIRYNWCRNAFHACP